MLIWIAQLLRLLCMHEWLENCDCLVSVFTHPWETTCIEWSLSLSIPIYLGSTALLKCCTYSSLGPVSCSGRPTQLGKNSCFSRQIVRSVLGITQGLVQKLMGGVLTSKFGKIFINPNNATQNLILLSLLRLCGIKCSCWSHTGVSQSHVWEWCGTFCLHTMISCILCNNCVEVNVTRLRLKFKKMFHDFIVFLIILRVWLTTDSSSCFKSLQNSTKEE